MRTYLVALLFCLFVQVVNGQQTLISGTAADYSAKEIVFYTYSDPILHTKFELGKTIISRDGSFSVALPINQTIEIYSDLEKFCGTMVVEPNSTYQITLPPFSPKTIPESRSIFFKPTLYWFGLTKNDPLDLNLAVRSFLSDLNIEKAKFANQIYLQKSKAVVGEIIERLTIKYSTDKRPYFKTLMTYSFSELEYAVNPRDEELVIQKYFASKPLALNHPMYQQAFRTIFNDNLRRKSQEIKNKRLVALTNSGNYLELTAFFKALGYSADFSELAVLKGLYDGYYTDGFKKSGISNCISAALNKVTSPDLSLIAQNIKLKIEQLVIGNQAPDINLLNSRKETVTLNKFNGKFVYLNFFKSTSSDCKAELDSIVSIEKRLRQILVVVSVCLDDDFDDGIKLWKSKGYSWELLNGSKQKQLIIDYNASLTPAFYLIDTNQKIQLSQAPSPSHGFEPTFVQLIRNYKRRSSN